MRENQLLYQFSKDRQNRGCSADTIRRYEDFILPWLRFRRRTPQGLGTFLTRYTNEQTRRNAWVRIKTFEVWTGATWPLKVVLRFAPPPHPRVLTSEEANALIASARQPYQAILAALYYTGARLTAILQLRPDDLDLSGGTVRLRTKGRVQADVCLPPPLVPILAAHTHDLPAGSPWLWPSPTHPGCHADGPALRRALREAADCAGITRRVYPHLLRHSCATELVNRGVPLECVQRQLLHRSIQTTQIYAKVGLSRTREAIAGAWGQ